MKYVGLEQISPEISKLIVKRPEVRNALNWQAMEEFSQVIDQLKTERETRLLLIGGEGKAFISGADLGLVSKLDTAEEGERLASLMGETLAELRTLPMVTIAMIDGPARGGGAEIAVSCDLRFMASTATIGFVQTSLGLAPGWGGAHRLFDLVGYSKALEFLASARTINAEEALTVGLVNGVFPDPEYEIELLAFCQKVVENSAAAILKLKELFLKWEAVGGRDRRFAERELFLELWSTDERSEKIEQIMIKREVNEKK